MGLMIEQTVFTDSERQAKATPWKEVVAKYQEPSLWRSTWQIVNSTRPLCGALVPDVPQFGRVVLADGAAGDSWRPGFWCASSSFFTTAATVRFSNRAKPMMCGGSSRAC